MGRRLFENVFEMRRLMDEQPLDVLIFPVQKQNKQTTTTNMNSGM